MAVRVSSMALRVAVALELILGISLWVGRPLAPVLVHMALGLLIVALVWFLGVAQATVKGDSWPDVGDVRAGAKLAVLSPSGRPRLDRPRFRSSIAAGAGDRRARSRRRVRGKTVTAPAGCGHT